MSRQQILIAFSFMILGIAIVSVLNDIVSEIRRGKIVIVNPPQSGNNVIGVDMAQSVEDQPASD